MGGLLRLAGIVVGVFTLLRLATLGFHVEYKPFFQSFMDWAENIVELGFLIDVIEKIIVQPALEWIRSFGWPIPELQARWRPVFTLSWLLYFSLARPFMRHAPNILAITGIVLICGTLALFPAVAVGTLTDNPYVAAGWPMATIAMVGYLLASPTARNPGARHSLAFAMCMFVLICVTAPFLIPVPTREFFGLDPEAIGLFAWLAVIVFFGVGFVVESVALRHESAENRALLAGVGIDILSVIGLALGVGYIMQE
jgi:hypothetical protein